MIPRFHIATALTLFALTIWLGASHASAIEPPKPGGQRMKVAGVALYVDDLAKAKRFYVEMLGMEALATTADSTELELRSGDQRRIILRAAVARPMSTGAQGANTSFTLQVNDLDVTLASLAAFNIKMIDREIRKEGVGVAATIIDPAGNPVSLMQVTIAKTPAFIAPKLCNFGLYIPVDGYERARQFWCDELGFKTYTDRYLPRDAPLRHADDRFAFMLHMREVQPPLRRPIGAPRTAMIFTTTRFDETTAALRKLGSAVTEQKSDRSPTGPRRARFEDAFGVASELHEIS